MGWIGMEHKLKTAKQRIESLRNEMMQTFVNNGADMRDPQVLHLSQLLDEQLNRYERCVRYQPPVKAARINSFPYISYKRNA